MVKVTSHTSCSKKILDQMPLISQSLNKPGMNIKAGVMFDEALVMGDTHISSTWWDKDSSAHINIRMSNGELRKSGKFIVLHWRKTDKTPNFAPDSTNEDEYERIKADRKAKKLKARANAAAGQQTQAGPSSAAAEASKAKPSTMFVPRTVAKKPTAATPATNPPAAAKKPFPPPGGK